MTTDVLKYQFRKCAPRRWLRLWKYKNHGFRPVEANPWRRPTRWRHRADFSGRGNILVSSAGVLLEAQRRPAYHRQPRGCLVHWRHFLPVYLWKEGEKPNLKLVKLTPFQAIRAQSKPATDPRKQDDRECDRSQLSTEAVAEPRREGLYPLVSHLPQRRPRGHLRSCQSPLFQGWFQVE